MPSRSPVVVRFAPNTDCCDAGLFSSCSITLPPNNNEAQWSAELVFERPLWSGSALQTWWRTNLQSALSVAQLQKFIVWGGAHILPLLLLYFMFLFQVSSHHDHHLVYFIRSKLMINYWWCWQIAGDASMFKHSLAVMRTACSFQSFSFGFAFCLSADGFVPVYCAIAHRDWSPLYISGKDQSLYKGESIDFHTGVFGSTRISYTCGTFQGHRMYKFCLLYIIYSVLKCGVFNTHMLVLHHLLINR